jgi:hypothetical protein
MKIVMFYEMAPGALQQLNTHFPAHRARLDVERRLHIGAAAAA